jgi:hypothetical protein
MLKVLPYVLLLAGILSCRESSSKDEFYSVQDGVLIEKWQAGSEDSTGHYFNRDNKIFKPGNKFTYQYQYLNPAGELFYMKIDSQDYWNFVPMDAMDTATITKVEMHVHDFWMESVDDNQTLIGYHLNPYPYSSVTTVAENSANIWLHPPRQGLFGYLQLNPFPYVKFPLRIGNTWEWKLGIGSAHSDERWAIWEGVAAADYYYEITKKETIETSLGPINCYVVKSLASSRLGETELTSWFNEKYGFVRLEYINIDKSKINLELTEVNF